MLQPQKKKLNPAQKARALTSKTKSKTPASYDVDWDAVRSVNDNVAVQTAKMFDPTGISSYPDVYYAAKDLSEGKGSWGELGLNVLGALPMIGKAKVAFRLAKASRASKTVKNTKKAIKVVEEVASKLNKVTNPVKIKPLVKAKSVVSSSKQIGKSDVKNVAIDLLDIGNVAADAVSVAKQVPGAAKQTVENTKKVVETTKEVAKKVVNKTEKLLETPSLIDKNKVIQYYNTDPKRGEVEKPGQLADVQYVPVSNSVELNKWKEQKLAYGTNSQGIMKAKMNPRKKYANGSSAKGMNPNNYIVSPAEAMNDYNIMMAEVENQAINNPWAPYVAAIGGATQSFLGGSAKLLTKGGGIDPGDADADTDTEDTDTETTKVAMGTNNVQTDVEVEGGEMYETPQGQVGEFKGPSHAEGGIPLEVGQDVQEGTKVYSDRLKVGDKTLAERKATRERQVANLEKIASQPLVDQAIKNASKRKMMAIQKEEIADLDFQEKVNNIQQMADNMVAAFGTGMAGLQGNPIGDSMRYAGGTGVNGVQKYPWGTPPFGVKFQKNPYADPKNYDTNAIKNLHDALGIASTENGYGTNIGPMTLEKLKPYMKSSWANSLQELTPNSDPNYYNNLYGSDPKSTAFYEKSTMKALKGQLSKEDNGLYTKDLYKSLGLTPEGSKYTGPKSNFFGDMADDVQGTLPKTDFSTEALASRLTEIKDPFAMTAGEDWKKKTDEINKAAGIPESMPESIDYQSKFFPNGFSSAETKTNSAEEGAEKPTAMGNLMRSLPAMGDAIKLFGNYKGMTAGIDTATEQRASDVTKTNVYRNAGEESQRMLDNAKKGIDISKAQAIVKATANTRGGMKGGRNASRGVNQMKAMNYLYTAGLNQQIADITAGAAEKMSAIDVQKSGVAMNADQMKGAGEWQAIMANDADKDAYYTALGLGRKDFATGLQQSGKDLNDMKQNKVIENLMKQYGKYFKGDKTGISNKDVASTDKKATIHTVNGIKYKEDANGNLIKTA